MSEFPLVIQDDLFDIFDGPILQMDERSYMKGNTDWPDIVYVNYIN